MGKFWRFGTWIGFLLLSDWAVAQSLPFQNISQGDFDNIVSEFSANSMHSSVSGASSLGKIFGFELGLTGGFTMTPEINKIIQRNDAAAKADRLPHATLLGAFSVPMGFTLEASFIPKMGKDEFKYGITNLALKWTMTDALFDWPLSVALKAVHSSNDIEIAQTISSVPTTFKYKNSSNGILALFSKDLYLVEPYVGLGFVKAAGKMDVTGSSSVFNFTSSQSASAGRSSAVYLAGVELKLLIAKLGVEYGRSFGTSTINGKAAFYF